MYIHIYIYNIHMYIYIYVFIDLSICLFLFMCVYMYLSLSLYLSDDDDSLEGGTLWFISGREIGNVCRQRLRGLLDLKLQLNAAKTRFLCRIFLCSVYGNWWVSVRLSCTSAVFCWGWGVGWHSLGILCLGHCLTCASWRQDLGGCGLGSWQGSSALFKGLAGSCFEASPSSK